MMWGVRDGRLLEMTFIEFESEVENSARTGN
jgi:hypothetical protein